MIVDKLKRYKVDVVIVLALMLAAFAYMQMGVSAEKYSAKALVHLTNEINENWEILDTHFGSPPNVGEAMRIVLLPKDGRLLDLMVQGDAVVTEKYKLEYINIPVNDITKLLHIHISPNNPPTYVVGGSILSGIDQAPNGQVGVFYSNVPFAVLRHVEQMVDGTADPSRQLDNKGRVHYVKRQNDAQYELGIYNRQRIIAN